MTKPAVDVVVPTFNGRSLLASCLARLRQQTAPHSLIVADNASSDGTTEFLSEHHPEATVVPLPTNRGFAAAVNAGVRAGSADIVVLVNNDVECQPNFIERITAPLLGDRSVGMVAGLLLQADGNSVDSLGLELDPTLAAFPRHWGRRCLNGALTATEGLLGPTGGAAAYRRQALDAVGGFDESIFGYGEDIDLALRLRAVGWRCAAAPDAIGIHLGSASFGRHSSNQVYHRGWSRAYLLRKYGLFGRSRVLPRIIVSEGGSVVWQLARTRDSSGLRGRAAGWRAAKPELGVPGGAVNHHIGFLETVRRRRSFRA